MSTSAPPRSKKARLRARIKRLHEGLVKIAYRNTESLAEKYAKQCPSPNTEPDDLVQHVWVKLLDWLQDPKHQETAEGLLEDPVQAVKFMQTFSKCRICDYLDYWFGGIRDARRTLHASQSFKAHDDPDYCPGIVGLNKAQVTGYALTEGPNSDWQSTITDLRSDCETWEGKLLVDYMSNPPQFLREAFWKNRRKLIRGTCRLLWPVHPDNPSDSDTLLELHDPHQEGKVRRIYLAGEPNDGCTMTKEFVTGAGPATARWAPRSDLEYHGHDRKHFRYNCPIPGEDMAAWYPDPYRGRKMRATRAKKNLKNPVEHRRKPGCSTPYRKSKTTWECRNMEISFECGLILNLNASGRLVGRKSLRGIYVWDRIQFASKAWSMKLLEKLTGLGREGMELALMDIEEALCS